MDKKMKDRWEKNDNKRAKEWLCPLCVEVVEPTPDGRVPKDHDCEGAGNACAWRDK